jgi:hypothetical protein
MKLSGICAQFAQFRLLIVAIVCLVPRASHARDELRFFSFEHVKSDTDARDRMVVIDISRTSPLLHYQFQETPTGSLSQTVKSIEFNRDMELTDSEVESVFKRLVSAGIFKLPRSSEHRGEGNLWDLSGSLSGREFELSHRLLPRSGIRKQIDDVIKSIIHEFGLDQINGPAYATLVRKAGTSTIGPSDVQDRPNPPAVSESEGDLIPPRETALQELISHADKFDGKRVSVLGFYHSEFEGNELRFQEKSDERENVWCEVISSFASKDVAFKQDSWARVDGTFLKGPSGHFGMWPGEITRVTRFELQTRPTFAGR